MYWIDSIHLYILLKNKGENRAKFMGRGLRGILFAFMFIKVATNGKIWRSREGRCPPGHTTTVFAHVEIWTILCSVQFYFTKVIARTKFKVLRRLWYLGILCLFLLLFTISRIHLFELWWVNVNIYIEH